VASNESNNLTPAPPSQPKNPAYTRSFQYNMILTKESGTAHGRPPRPLNATTNAAHASLTTSSSDQFNATGGSTNASAHMAKTAPASLNNMMDEYGMLMPSPPPMQRPPTHHQPRAWNSTERITSGSLRLSRASTRTSLASDDLDKYISGAASSLDVDALNNPNLLPPNSFVSNNNNNLGGGVGLGGSNANSNQAMLNNIFSKPVATVARVSSTNSMGNMKLGSGRDRGAGGSVNDAAFDLMNINTVSSMSASSQAPPPIKVNTKNYIK
jgi:hypothetical protein